MNPYQILGVSENASEDEIKKAYRELAKKWHPDVNKDEKAEDKFKEISAAYESLKNNNWRYSEPRNNNSFDIQDIFNNFGIFDFGFNPFQQKRNIRKKRTQIQISLEDAFNGCSKKIILNEEIPCPICNHTGFKLTGKTCSSCNGNGRVRSQSGVVSIATTCSKCMGMGREIESKCSSCNGNGKTIQKKELILSIPPGTRYGSILTPEPDLEVVILLSPHNEFVLLNDGIDIGSAISIDIFTAMLGDSVNVNTLSGAKKLKIPAGIQPKTILKIREGGFNKSLNGARGDHLVEININIPINLTEEQKEKINKFKEDFNTK